MYAILPCDENARQFDTLKKLTVIVPNGTHQCRDVDQPRQTLWMGVHQRHRSQFCPLQDLTDN